MNRLTWVLLLNLLTIEAVYAVKSIKTTEISTTDIISAPILDRSCHNYCLTGVCVWLFCGLHGCSIKTSIRVRHYQPDLVVSAYDKAGANPWRDARNAFGRLEKKATSSLVSTFHDVEAGYGERTEGHSSADRSLRYKEATAIGHPLAATKYLNVKYWCPTQSDPMMPYFSSGFDALAWRLGLTEIFYVNNFLPGARVIGEGGYTQQWGPLFPRTGFVNQKDDVKASAIIAQRVGNIVTQNNQPHVYQRFRDVFYRRLWLPGQLRENDSDTGLWQMLAPTVDDQCYVFGENDVFSTRWSDGRDSEDNAYVYALWRPYECCQARGAYITTIEAEVCL